MLRPLVIWLGPPVEIVSRALRLLGLIRAPEEIGC